MANMIQATISFTIEAWKWIKVTTALATLLGMTWFIAVQVERYEQRQILAATIAVERAEAYGRFGTEVHILGQLLVAEIGAHPDEWDEVTETLLGRMESDMFPNTLEGVAKQLGENHWQFVGMGDAVPDMMVTEQGLAAIAFAEKTLRAYYTGTYEFSLPGVHSFCVPSACKAASAYFDQFCIVAKRKGHNYYGGDRTSPSAPCHSKRPAMRPTSIEQSVALAEQVEQQILKSVQVALTE